MVKHKDNTKFLVGAVVALVLVAAFLYSMPAQLAENEAISTAQPQKFAMEVNSGAETKAVILSNAAQTTAEVL